MGAADRADGWTRATRLPLRRTWPQRGEALGRRRGRAARMRMRADRRGTLIAAGATLEAGRPTCGAGRGGGRAYFSVAAR